MIRATCSSAHCATSPFDAKLGVMEVEVFADIVCPWCYIGKRKLEAAVKLAGIEVKITERAFQLDPTAPAVPRRTVELLGEKYRMSEAHVHQMMKRVTDAGAEVGLTYHLERTLSGNTLMAHRLLKHAESAGMGTKAWEHFYRAYFTDGRSLFDAASLETLSEEIGLKGARDVLASDEYMGVVEQDFALAREFQITGVPFFVADRRLAVSGAQPAEVLADMLQQATR